MNNARKMLPVLFSHNNRSKAILLFWFFFSTNVRKKRKKMQTKPGVVVKAVVNVFLLNGNAEQRNEICSCLAPSVLLKFIFSFIRLWLWLFVDTNRSTYTWHMFSKFHCRHKFCWRYIRFGTLIRTSQVMYQYLSSQSDDDANKNSDEPRVLK